MPWLTLVRHAKSSWEQEGLDDHERPLNRRGLRTAPRMGEYLRGFEPPVDLFWSSTARRAQETAELLRESLGSRAPLRLDRRLYLAPPEGIRDLVSGLEEEQEAPGHVLLVAHNPGLEVLVSALAGRPVPFPTCAAARIELPRAWEDLGAGRARLVELARPREVLGDSG